MTPLRFTICIILGASGMQLALAISHGELARGLCAAAALAGAALWLAIDLMTRRRP